MKIKNVKVGQRVEHKGSGSDPQRKGAQGVIINLGGIYPHIKWDDQVHNRSYNGEYGSENPKNLRKVK